MARKVFFFFKRPLGPLDPNWPIRLGRQRSHARLLFRCTKRLPSRLAKDLSPHGAGVLHGHPEIGGGSSTSIHCSNQQDINILGQRKVYLAEGSLLVENFRPEKLMLNAD